jgi:uncharacterized protein YndB with AHSA1/START domain
MSDGKPTFVHVSYIATSADKLFAALTDGKFTQEYWGGKRVHSDWKKGSPVRWSNRGGGAHGLTGVVLECDPPSLLAYTWQQGDNPATKVTFQVKQVSPGNVRLQVTHELHEPGSEIADNVREGWAAVLSSLKSYLETGEALESTKLWEQRSC